MTSPRRFSLAEARSSPISADPQSPLDALSATLWRVQFEEALTSSQSARRKDSEEIAEETVAADEWPYRLPVSMDTFKYAIVLQRSKDDIFQEQLSAVLSMFQEEPQRVAVSSVDTYFAGYLEDLQNTNAPVEEGIPVVVVLLDASAEASDLWRICSVLKRVEYVYVVGETVRSDNLQPRVRIFAGSNELVADEELQPEDEKTAVGDTVGTTLDATTDLATRVSETSNHLRVPIDYLSSCPLEMRQGRDFSEYRKIVQGCSTVGENALKQLPPKGNLDSYCVPQPYGPLNDYVGTHLGSSCSVILKRLRDAMLQSVIDKMVEKYMVDPGKLQCEVRSLPAEGFQPDLYKVDEDEISRKLKAKIRSGPDRLKSMSAAISAYAGVRGTSVIHVTSTLPTDVWRGYGSIMMASWIRAHICGHNSIVPLISNAPNVLRVKPGPRTISAGHSYATINEALSAADRCFSRNDHVIIFIEPGEYDETISIKRSNISVIGSGVGSTIIRSDGAPVLLFDAPSGLFANLSIVSSKNAYGFYSCVQIANGDVRFINCNIQCSTTHGFKHYTGVRITTDKQTMRDSRPYFYNTTVKGFQRGIQVTGDCKVGLEQCTIEDCRDVGMHAEERTAITMNRVVVRNIGEHGVVLKGQVSGHVNSCLFNNIGGSGISITSNSHPTVVDSKFVFCRCGIELDLQGHATVVGCYFIRNHFTGVIAKVRSDPLLLGNIFHFNGRSGVEICENSTGSLIWNGFSMGPIGVAVIGKSEPECWDCTFHSCGKGLDIRTGSKGTYTRNKFEKTLKSSIQVSNFSTDPLIFDCQMEDSFENGIWTTDRCRPSILDCTIARPKKSGLLVSDGGNPKVKQVTIEKAEFHGVSIAGEETKGKFERLTISTCGRSGIHMNGFGCTPVFQDCHVFECDSGVHACKGVAGKVLACEIVRHLHNGVFIESGATPTIENCQISECNNAGILISGAHTSGDIACNNIFAHREAGVSIVDGATPKVEKNNIYRCIGFGISIDGKGSGGVIEDNDIFENTHSNVVMRNECSPELVGNQIHIGQQCGILCLSSASGSVRENTIFQNMKAGIAIKSDANVEFKGNDICENEGHGVHVFAKGKGDFVANDIHHNKGECILVVNSGSEPHIARNTLRDSALNAICVQSEASAVIEENEISAIQDSGIRISGIGTTATVSANQIHSCQFSAIVVTDGADSKLEGNAIYECGQRGITCASEGDVIVGSNEVYLCEGSGIFVTSPSGSNTRIEFNRVYKNTQDGIVVVDEAKPVLHRNDIFLCANGIRVSGSTSTTVSMNTIYENRECGVIVEHDATGNFEGNRIFDNKDLGCVCKDRCVPVFTQTQFRANLGGGVTLGDVCGPVFSKNTFELHAKHSIRIENECQAQIVNNTITGTGEYGVIFGEKSTVRFEANKVNNVRVGVWCREETQSTIVRNVISSCSSSCVYIGGDCDPEIEENELGTASKVSVHITESSCPLLRQNKISSPVIIDGIAPQPSRFVDNKFDFESVPSSGDFDAAVTVQGSSSTAFQGNIVKHVVIGVLVRDKSRMVSEGNTFSLCSEAAILVRDYGKVDSSSDMFDQNYISIHMRDDGIVNAMKAEFHNCTLYGILFEGIGGGVLDACRVFGSRSTESSEPQDESTALADTAGICIRNGANPSILRSHIQACPKIGVLIEKGGVGLLEHCVVCEAGTYGVLVRTKGNPHLKNTRMFGCVHSGYRSDDEGEGIVEDCEIYGNELYGVSIDGYANPSITKCSIYQNLKYGIHFGKFGQGSLEDNDVHSNTYAEWWVHPENSFHNKLFAE